MKNVTVRKIIFVFILIPSLIRAQADLKELEKLNASYKKASAYKFVLKYSSFNDYQTPIETDAFTMKIFADATNYYCKRSENEVLINEQYQLIVDRENKILFIDEHKKSQKTKKEMITEMGLDSLIQKMATQANTQDPQVKIELKKISEEEKQYILNYSAGEFTSVKIQYNATSFLISKMILYYREKIETVEGQPQTTPRVEISYLQTDLQPQFDKKTFSEKKYAQIKKDGNLELVAEFKNYKVINHLLK